MSKTQKLLIKYGGNAMTNEQIKKQVLTNIGKLQQQGHQMVIVHGGGPYIQKALNQAQIASEFIDGQRKTSDEAIKVVEMALKGDVNGSLVGLLNHLGHKAVGLSGKDGNTLVAKKRSHQTLVDGQMQDVDMGQVGNVDQVNTGLLHTLLQAHYLPVMTCIANDTSGATFNINADMFAGAVAGAMKADEYIVLTDVDGLLEDKDNPYSLMSNITTNDVHDLIRKGIIQGGMIPKMESCIMALETGAKSARIINGTKPEQIAQLQDNPTLGTLISA